MNGYVIKQLRTHVGVMIPGFTVTSVDTTKHECSIDRVDGGFIIERRGEAIWIPDTNVVFITMEKSEPRRSNKAA